MTAVIYQIYKDGELVMETADFMVMEGYKTAGGYEIRKVYVEFTRKEK